MILQALTEYYDRKKANPNSNVPPYPWEWKRIPYLIVLDVDGNVVDFVSTYEGEGNKKEAKSFLVPLDVGRTSNEKANLLWDNPEYILGVSLGKDGTDRTATGADTKTQKFLDRIKDLGEVNDQGLNAVRKFLDKPSVEKKNSLIRRPVWQELIADMNQWITFKVGTRVVVDSPLVIEAVNSSSDGEEEVVGRCLVTNAEEPIAITHHKIKGVNGAQSFGTVIVGFNEDSFCSYGKDKGKNAPVSKIAAFKYMTALNMLLDKDSPNRFKDVKTSTIVVWGERECDLEKQIPLLFDDPDKDVENVKQVYESIRNGAWTDDEQEGRFYILSLSPNAARLSVRFWQVSTVQETAESIVQYFDDIRIVHSPKDVEHLSLSQILESLDSTPRKKKKNNIPSYIEDGMVRAIFERTPFSNTLLQAAIRRNCLEQNVTYPRASVIKACLNRMVRFYKKNEEELKVSLDKSNTNIGYRLGRLFAVLEKIQEKANPGLNSTIRDRYYGSASGAPGTVFPSLMRLKNHHLSKMDNKGFFENLLGEIISEISDFPRFLTLEDQGRFAIGYYHQRQDFYTKKEVRDADEKEDREQNNEAPLLEYGS